ncbi:MAG: chemotaxis response regulator protein-glutamate methylesterase [Treponemataceae bacterium]|nr:chemotaxis response regulator protein-glutamate methylesterase [Treponemataceae bacterium]
MDDISVLVCDDSALMRNLVSRAVESVPGMHVVGRAENGKDLIEKLPQANPDVIILDIEMPVMSGVDFLKHRKENRIKIPVIILSSVVEKGAALAMQCLELGAADFITKPNGSISADITKISDRLIEMISSYGGQYARLHGKTVYRDDFYAKIAADRAVERKLQGVMSEEKLKEFLDKEIANKAEEARRASEMLKASLAAKPKEIPVITPVRASGKIDIIAIGISTGGPNALRDMFKMIDPRLKQPVLVVQHMPAGFTKEFASSLNRICALEVKEAEDGDKIEGGHVYIAPGSFHMFVEKEGLQCVIRLSQEPPRNGHRPSADVLFESVAKVYQNKALGVIMTGMGKDGAVQLAEMRKQGAWTLGQDEKSSIVYGMPRVANELGAVQKQVPLAQMADEISKLAREHVAS